MVKWIVYLLAIGVFVTATSELVVSGILAEIAGDLNISIGLAGQLITAYSLSFAIGTPIVISLASRIGRKKVLLGAIAAFVLGGIVSVASQTFVVLMFARILLGVSSGVYLVVSIGTAAKLVQPEKLGSTIATIILGFSSALIAGVPIGIVITEWLNWQAIFAILSLLALLAGAMIYRLLPEVDGDEPVSFKKSIKWLGSSAVLAGLLLSLFREGGGSVLLTYMTPYLQELHSLELSQIGIIMLVFGLVGALGSKLGGYSVDRRGAVPVIAAAVITHIAALSLLPLAGGNYWMSLLLLGLIFFSMFAAGPAMQSYFIQKAPQAANFILSIHTSIIHLGLAAGAGIGGLGVYQAATLKYHPWIAALMLGLGLAIGAAIFAAGSARSRSFSA
ncbi:MFS transporter [Paenibacillus sp. GCM10027627]